MENYQNIRHKSFRIIAVCLPFLFFIFLEILLRIFHVGYSTQLFIKDNHNDSLIHNNLHISRLFFNSWDAAPNAYVQYFAQVKAENTFRIFVLGESSALGFPYNHRGSFPRMLHYMLEKSYPEKNIEVINLAITGINSYALLSFADEIATMNPDAVLIYTGHNEYYGALGAGSMLKSGSNRDLIKFTIKLKRLRIVQLGLRMAGKLHDLFTKENNRNDSGLMIKMAGDQKIVYNGRTYKKGLKQFESNMHEMLEIFNKHRIPVYFSDLISNLRGQRPFTSELGITTDTAAFMKAFQSGYLALKRGNKDTALEFFQVAEKIDSTYALNNFLMAEILYDQGKFSDAWRYYNNAKELDVLRFRAPEDINRIIRTLSVQFDNVYLVDALEVLRRNAPHGILGNELFTDHLHPNLEGNFQLARAFYEELKASRDIDKINTDIATGTFRSEMPVTLMDSLLGTWLIQHMKQKWPFFEKTQKFDVGGSYPEQLAFRLFNKQLSWDLAMDSLYKYYLANQQIAEAIKVAKAYDLEHPSEFNTPGEIGRLYQQSGNFSEAYYYFKKAFDKSHDVYFARKIVIVMMKMDKPGECRSYLEMISSQDPGDKNSANLLRMTENVVKAKNIIQKQPRHSESVKILARYYLYIGNLNMAKMYIDHLPEMGSSDPLMREYYKKLKETEQVTIL